MDDSGQPPSPAPPWGSANQPAAVPALPPPPDAAGAGPVKRKKDHGAATAKERFQRYKQRQKASRSPNLLAPPGTNRTLSPTAWKPGQSGNPKGIRGSALYKEAQKICREASPTAAQRMIELMDDKDTRVAFMAAQHILERAWGKPREYDPSTDPENQMRFDVGALTPEQREILREIMKQAVTIGGRPG